VNARSRPVVPGFGALFVLGVAKALADVPPLTSECVASAIDAPTPPTWCPCCCFPAVGAQRDERGRWSWSCFGGCNP
jgi:hypothetical protein